MKERNKESSWEECLFHKTARQTPPDKYRSKFLLRTSLERVEYLQTLEITGKSINFIFESYYTSIVELIQSITLLDGYNIINHLCLGYYLKDVLEKNNLFRIFDMCRFRRNKLIYYGKMMEFEIAKYTLEQAKILMEELESFLNKKLQ